MKGSVIRVLQVFTILNRGGAESMIMNYYRNIDRDKVQFDFLVHRPERGAFEDEIESMGGKVYRMPRINPLFPNKYYKELDKFLKTHNYKVIHSHINTFSSFPLRIAENNNIPCRIAHAHIALEGLNFKNVFSSKRMLEEEIKKTIKVYLKTYVSDYATHLFSCGLKAGKWLFNEKEFTLVENAIDTSLYTPNKSKASEFRKNMNLDDKLLIGHVGRFSNQKNHFFILAVFKQIREREENSCMIFVGDGELRNEIEKEAKRLNVFDDVLFLGVRSDVPDQLQIMDVFLFPSFYEGLPVTLIEAQTAGLKIFASDTITDEVAFTDDISFLSLNKSAEYWAEEILKSVPYKRKDNSEIIKNKGYDIVESAKWLENFYLKQYEG
ncbi:MAG TPA: glycosyltransferase family 1 protein [Gallicola sp.]|nr:glycosyltransferase family 1 protein [Gallicola sp.]